MTNYKDWLMSKKAEQKHGEAMDYADIKKFLINIKGLFFPGYVEKFASLDDYLEEKSSSVKFYLKRLLSGIQPTGVITLGNYVGAIKQMVKLQENNKAYIFVADMHAITVPQDPSVLHQNIRNLLALYIACGIDPEKNIIFLPIVL